jgi:4-oxalocrotonate tautomerase
MPLIQMQILEGRSEKKIEAVIENVSDTVSETLDVPKQNVRVLVSEIPKSHWGIGGDTAKDLGK